MFETLFGSGMPLAARFFVAFLVVLGLIGLTAWGIRRFGANRIGAGAARGRQPRLAVIDAASVDGRRRLVLVRRDNIEHLLMIGGPTDIVVETNIIRAAGVRDTGRTGSAVESASSRGVNTADAWPIQPLSEPAPPARSPRASAIDEPWLPPEPGARPRPIDMPADLPTRSSDIGIQPRNEPTPRMSAAPSPSSQASDAMAAHTDQNLADMALQLEAALRRPSTQNPLPARGVTEEKLTSPQTRQSEPTMRTPFSLKASSEPKKEPISTGTSDAHRAFTSEQSLSKAGFKSDMSSSVKAEPHFESTATQGKKAYDSLEEEMANLLGRPSNKT